MSVHIARPSTQAMHLAFLALLVIAVYGGTLPLGFVWDDGLVMLPNEAYRTQDLSALTHSNRSTLDYLPVRDASVMLDFYLWGPEMPMGFHLQNLVIYVLTVLFAYLTTTLLLRGMSQGPQSEGRARLMALTASALYAVHPIHSDAVAFVSHRNTLLSGMFLFMCAHAWLKHFLAEKRAIGWYALSFLFFVLALCSKQSAIVLPVILGVMALCLGASARRSLSLLAPFLAVSAFSYAIFSADAREAGMASGAETNAALGILNPMTRVPTALQIPFFYLRKLLAPYALSAFHQTEFARTIGSRDVLLAIAGMCVLLATGFVLRNRARLIVFGMLFFYVSLMPFLNFFITSPVVSDHYAHIPSYGFALILAAALFRLADGKLKALAAALALSLAVAWSALAVSTNRIWESDRTFWENTLAAFPQSPEPYARLAKQHLLEGDFKNTLAYSSRLHELDPAHPTPYFMLGTIFLQLNREDAAIDMLKRATEEPGKLRPDTFYAIHTLGRIYEDRGDWEGAIGCYTRLLRADPVFTLDLREDVLDRLARIRLALAPRVQELARRIEEYPADTDARIERARMLALLGRHEEAVAAYTDVLRTSPNMAAIYFSIARIRFDLGEYEKAIDGYGRGLTLGPSAEALDFMGLAYKHIGRHDRAIDAFERAIAAGPDHMDAYMNLALLYRQLGDAIQARAYFKEMARRFPARRDLALSFMDGLSE